MLNKIKALTLSSAAIAALVVPFAAAPPAFASNSTSVSAYVACPYGQSIQGLYVKANNGSYWGWASWGPTNNGGLDARFNFSADIVTDVTLSIGCGGSRQSWGHSYSATIQVFRVGSQRFVVDCRQRTYPSCAAYEGG